jgi:hypothetical protein
MPAWQHEYTRAADTWFYSRVNSLLHAGTTGRRDGFGAAVTHPVNRSSGTVTKVLRKRRRGTQESQSTNCRLRLYKISFCNSPTIQIGTQNGIPRSRVDLTHRHISSNRRSTFRVISPTPIRENFRSNQGEFSRTALWNFASFGCQAVLLSSVAYFCGSFESRAACVRR